MLYYVVLFCNLSKVRIERQYVDALEGFIGSRYVSYNQSNDQPVQASEVRIKTLDERLYSTGESENYFLNLARLEQFLEEDMYMLSDGESKHFKIKEH